MVAFRCRPAVRPVYFDFLTHCFYDAPQSVESIWASDQPVAETSTWQHTTLTTDKQTNIHDPRGIRNHNLSRRAAEDRAATGIGKSLGEAGIFSRLSVESCVPWLLSLGSHRPARKAENSFPSSNEVKIKYLPAILQGY